MNIPLLTGESVDGGKPSAKDSTGLVGLDGLDAEVGGGNGWPVPSILGTKCTVSLKGRKVGSRRNGG